MDSLHFYTQATVETIAAKALTSAQIQEQTEAYIEHGGEITVLDYGVRTDSPVDFNNQLRHSRQMDYDRRHGVVK